MEPCRLLIRTPSFTLSEMRSHCRDLSRGMTSLCFRRVALVITWRIDSKEQDRKQGELLEDKSKHELVVAQTREEAVEMVRDALNLDWTLDVKERGKAACPQGF